MVVMEKMKASEANLECHYSIDELVLSPMYAHIQYLVNYRSLLGRNRYQRCYGLGVGRHVVAVSAPVRFRVAPISYLFSFSSISASFYLIVE